MKEIYFIAVGIGLLVFYFFNRHLKNKKLQNKMKFFINNFGKQKQISYFNFDKIEQYFVNSNNKNKAFHILSEQVKKDLNFNDLFKFLDRTTSKIGQQYLYYKLNVIPLKKDLLIFGKLTDLFVKNSDLRIKTQLSLSKLNSYNAYNLEKLIHDKLIDKPSYRKYLWPLSIISLIVFVFGWFYPILFFLLIPVFTINLFLHLKNKTNINYYLEAIHQLRIASNVGNYLSSLKPISSHFKDLSFLSNIKRIAYKTRFISFEKNLSNEFVVIFWFVLELFKILFNVESILFYRFIDAVIKERKEIDKLYQFLGEIDCAISTASLVSGKLTTCKPVFNANKIISAKDIIHPLIKNCVPNNIELDNKSMLLTGSNMSGKTTFIRSFAVNALLSETLNFAFATNFSIPFFKIYSSINVEDDLLESTSYYLKEVLIVKKLIQESQSETPCLFVLDEIFKGTNTIERISGGKAILSYLNKKNHFVLVSTHDVELTDLLSKKYDLYHFSEQIINEKLIFDHKLKKGKLKTKNAIKILDIYGYPKEIIAEAKYTENIFFKQNKNENT